MGGTSIKNDALAEAGSAQATCVHFIAYAFSCRPCCLATALELSS